MPSPPALMAAAVEHPTTLLLHPARPVPLLRLPASASVELAAAVAAAAAAAACEKSEVDHSKMAQGSVTYCSSGKGTRKGAERTAMAAAAAHEEQPSDSGVACTSPAPTRPLSTPLWPMSGSLCCAADSPLAAPPPWQPRGCTPSDPLSTAARPPSLPSASRPSPPLPSCMLLDSHIPDSQLAVCAEGGASQEDTKETTEVTVADEEAAQVELAEAVELEGGVVEGCGGCARPPLLDSGSESPAGQCGDQRNVSTSRK